MRAIILAAGRGSRLEQSAASRRPKCLIELGGKSLLERHLLRLAAAGVTEIVLVLGFLRERIEAELDRFGWQPRPQVVVNDRYELGSMLSLHAAADALTRGGDVLLMDADVLYHERIMAALAGGTGPANRVLIDRDFEPGAEPVKLCVRDGVPIELRKELPQGLEYDTVGESIGFFRLDETRARRLAQLTAGYIESGGAHLPHEEAVRDLLKEQGRRFEIADVTGIPWIEIDFPADVARAAAEVLPRLGPELQPALQPELQPALQPAGATEPAPPRSEPTPRRSEVAPCR